MRWGRMLVCALGLCAVDEHRAQAQHARVERRGPAEVAGTPGQPLTLPFRVTNLSEQPASFSAHPALPPGWRATAGGAPGTLAPGEAELRLLGVAVPASAAAGRHVVRYAAGGSSDSAVIVVSQRRGVTVEVAHAAPMVVAGTPYAVRFRVANRGNVAERLSLRAEGDQGLTPRADSAALVLPPGAERIVTLRAGTDRRTAASLRHQVRLRALAAGDTADAAAASALVTIVPRGGGAGAARRRLAAELQVRASDSLSAASASFMANGALDRAGRVRLDVLARSADPPGTPFARPDEYRLRLDAPSFSLRLGDDVYSLSRLTQPGRYGLGAAAWARRGMLSAGAMVARDRRGYGQGTVAGGFVRAGTRRMRVGAVVSAPVGAPARWTVEAAAEPHRLLWLEAEAAPAEASASLPRALRAAGHARGVSYEALHLRGAERHGGTGSPDQDFAAVTLRPFGPLSLAASIRRGGDFRAFGDTVQTFTTQRRAAVAWGSLLSLEYRASGRDTVSRGDVRAVRARLGIPLFRNAWLYPAYEAGEVVADPAAAPGAFRVASLQASVSARCGASLWATVHVRDGAAAYAEAGRELSGSLSAALPVLPGTWVRVSGDGRRMAGGRTDARLDLSLERALGRGHRLTVRGLANAREATGWATPRGYLEYAVPIAIPLPAERADGVTARVFDPATGRGIPNVLVRLADRVALTDRRGTAAFATLAPGSYTLRIEPGDGPERVADREMPLAVTVGAEGTQRVEVGLELAARMTGLVERVPADSAAALRADSAAGPLAGVEVELSGPGGVRRVVTDAEGRFSVAGLRPGWWRVRVIPASLPRHHEPGQGQTVLLAPGGEARAHLQVVERHRPVQVIQGGELTLR